MYDNSNQTPFCDLSSKEFNISNSKCIRQYFTFSHPKYLCMHTYILLWNWKYRISLWNVIICVIKETNDSDIFYLDDDSEIHPISEISNQYHKLEFGNQLSINWKISTYPKICVFEIRTIIFDNIWRITLLHNWNFFDNFLQISIYWYLFDSQDLLTFFMNGFEYWSITSFT